MLDAELISKSKAQHLVCCGRKQQNMSKFAPHTKKYINLYENQLKDGKRFENTLENIKEIKYTLTGCYKLAKQ